MNSLILLFAVFAVIAGRPLDIHNKDLTVSYGRECAKQSGIGPRALKALADSNPIDNDEGYKGYILCFLQKVGFLTAEAEFQNSTTVIEKWLSAEQAKEGLESAKSACGHLRGQTPGEAASIIYRCILESDI